MLLCFLDPLPPPHRPRPHRPGGGWRRESRLLHTRWLRCEALPKPDSRADPHKVAGLLAFVLVPRYHGNGAPTPGGEGWWWFGSGGLVPSLHALSASLRQPLCPWGGARATGQWLARKLCSLFAPRPTASGVPLMEHAAHERLREAGGRPIAHPPWAPGQERTGKHWVQFSFCCVVYLMVRNFYSFVFLITKSCCMVNSPESWGPGLGSVGCCLDGRTEGGGSGRVVCGSQS